MVSTPLGPGPFTRQPETWAVALDGADELELAGVSVVDPHAAKTAAIVAAAISAVVRL
jgi:hypothetical protein